MVITGHALAGSWYPCVAVETGAVVAVAVFTVTAVVAVWLNSITATNGTIANNASNCVANIVFFIVVIILVNDLLYGVKLERLQAV